MKSKSRPKNLNNSASTSKSQKQTRSNLIPFPVNYRLLLNKSEWIQPDIYRQLEEQYETLDKPAPYNTLRNRTDE